MAVMAYARHYCYRIDFADGFVYFGVRTCRCPIAADSYMGSPATYAAKWATLMPRAKTIVSVHATRELAEIAEDNLILAFWAVSKELSLNASINGAKFHRLGVKLTDEHRAKLSVANKGKPFTAERCASISAAHTGKTRTAEHCASMSAAHMGKPLSAEHRAALAEAGKGKKWWNDGTTSIQLKPGEVAPEGFRPGMAKLYSAEYSAKLSAARKGYKWYTDGVASIRVFAGDAIPEGLRPGMAKRKQL